MFNKAKFIRKCKQYGIDIIINDTGFKTSYNVYYKRIAKRFNSFNEARKFIEENIFNKQ